MVAGVFVYPHLFSTQTTNGSDLLTSDSPTRFLNRLVSVLVAVATLPLWEGLFRHTDPTPSSEKIKMSCCRATSSLIALYFKRSQRKMSYHPCPGEVFIKKWRKTTYRWATEAYLNRQLKIQRTKSVGGWKGTTKKPFRFKSAPPDFVNNQTWTITIPEGKI